jgi:hypothetical protein
VLGDYYEELIGRLEALYAQHPDSAGLDEGRRSAAVWARAQLEGPVGQRLRTYRIGRMTERPINNAQLIGARIYRTRLDLFDRWYQLHGRDVQRSVSTLSTLMEGVVGDSAYTRLEQAVNNKQ